MTPHSGKYVAYLRVSTQRQGQSGLGIEAQRKVVNDHLNGGEWEIIAEYVEHESGKRSDRRRKELAAALKHCKEEGATLIIANISRLTRNLAFLTRIIESQIPIIACDVPDMGNPSQNKFMLQMMANIAEYEGAMISDRTKNALAAKKARGESMGTPNPHAGARLGGAETASAVDAWAEELRPVIADLKKYGCDSLRKIAEGLEARGAKTFRGKDKWALSSVRNLLTRLGEWK